MRQYPSGRVFVLRIWYSAVDENGRFIPRYILEDPFTRIRRGFATLQELALYLDTLSEDDPPKSK